MQVGRTGLRVPLMGLGTAGLGGLYVKVQQIEAEEMIRYALDNGVNFFLDTRL